MNVMNAVLGRTWWEAVIASFKVLSRHLLELPRNTMKASVNIDGLLVKILLSELLNMKQECYPLYYKVHKIL
jgi:hypothetical protein